MSTCTSGAPTAYVVSFSFFFLIFVSFLCPAAGNQITSTEAIDSQRLKAFIAVAKEIPLLTGD